jgi:hypothetical protein
VVLTITLILLASKPSRAGVNVYNFVMNGGLAGFSAAAGNPPVSIDFDSIALNTDIGGSTIAGVTFNQPAGSAPLIVVDGNATVTPAGFSGAPNPATNKLFPTSGNNVLSPGGLTLGPGPNSPIENDDLELVFAPPLAAFGFDHLSQSADGFSFTSANVFNQSNSLIFSGAIPISNLGGGGAPGGPDFWGVIGTGGDLIGRILIDEADANAEFPDANIGFDTFRFFPTIPEPTALAVFSLGVLILSARRDVRRRR